MLEHDFSLNVSNDAFTSGAALVDLLLPCLLQTYYSPKTQPIFDLIFCLKKPPKTVFLGLIFQCVFPKKTVKNLTLKNRHMLLQAYQDLTSDHAFLLLKMTLFSWQEDSADNNPRT